jgi:hypothetical protein
MKVTTNNYKFESNVTALSYGNLVNKPKGYRFQIGDDLCITRKKISIII